MTLTGPSYPLSEPDALQHLRDALGDNYAGATDDATLTRALGVDGFTAQATFHSRPWATAARLITDNTEYEVTRGLQARLDRKLHSLTARQQQADALAGIYHLLPRAADEFSVSGLSGAVDTRSVF